MNYVLLYWSRFGHNKKIVEYIKEKLTNQGYEVKMYKTDEADPTNLPSADMYVFSASAEAFRLQRNMRIFMKKMKNMENKKFAIINTHGMKKKNWLKSMKKILAKKNMDEIAEIDLRIGDGQEKGEGLSDDWQDKIDEFIDKINDL